VLNKVWEADTLVYNNKNTRTILNHNWKLV